MGTLAVHIAKQITCPETDCEYCDKRCPSSFEHDLKWYVAHGKALEMNTKNCHSVGKIYSRLFAKYGPGGVPIGGIAHGRRLCRKGGVDSSHKQSFVCWSQASTQTGREVAPPPPPRPPSHHAGHYCRMPTENDDVDEVKGEAGSA